MAPNIKLTLRRFRFQLQTAFGLPARGFFIPYRYADKVPTSQNEYIHLRKVFDENRESFANFCQYLDQYSNAFDKFGEGLSPRWDQDWFARLDGAAAYGMVRQYKPKTIIEVGSGHSTRFMARAVQDGALDCRQVAIDPNPRATIKALPVEWDAQLLNEDHLEQFAALQANDIAFFDSSHILMPGTDVDMILNRIIPILKPGVLIHIHDVFLPYPYPEKWLWRGYNEQNVLGPMISSATYELLFASQYVAKEMQQQVAASCLENIPLVSGAYETSIWLKKAA